MGTQRKGRVGEIPQGGIRAGYWLSGWGVTPTDPETPLGSIFVDTAGTIGCADCPGFLALEYSAVLIGRGPLCLRQGMLRLKAEKVGPSSLKSPCLASWVPDVLVCWLFLEASGFEPL